MKEIGFPSDLPDILNNLLIFPPEPISETLFKSLVLFLIHFSTLVNISLFSAFLLFRRRTVPILKDFELIISPLENNVNSVLPPPTSTYK